MPVSATTRLESQRPQAVAQRTGQRSDFRGYPTTGVPWGQPDWEPDVANELNITFEVFAGVTVAPFADLATLAADATTYGDGVLTYASGANFTEGQFVTLEDASIAYYKEDAWFVGAATSALDLSVAIFGTVKATSFANLAALKADATTFGDGVLAYGSGADITEGQFVIVNDDSLAFYRDSVWALGAAPATEDISVEVFGVQPSALADLATLAADGTYGDGNLAYASGADFAEGYFVTLADDSVAYYRDSAWFVGAATATEDITIEVFGETPAPFADLATLAADATTYGDGVLTYGSGADFTEGQFVIVADDSIAYYQADEWFVGAATAAEDLTIEIFGVTPAGIADLATLAADLTYGDGNLAYNSGDDFGAGEFVILDDASLASYDTAAWAVGAHA